MAVAALSSCGSAADQPAAQSASAPSPEPTAAPLKTSATIPATEVPMTTNATTPTSTSADPLVAQAMADLATRLSVDTSAIAVTRHEEVSWSDGSLGCPKPGFNYPQVITAGYLIVLSVDGRQYEYHGKPGGAPFYCSTPRPPAAGATSGP